MKDCFLFEHVNYLSRKDLVYELHCVKQFFTLLSMMLVWEVKISDFGGENVLSLFPMCDKLR